MFESTILNVLPSYREGLPMTVLETMSYGIPNIVSDLPITKEIITDQVTGTLVSPGEIEELAQKIYDLCNNRDLRVRQSQSSYELVKTTFNINHHYSNLESLYRKVYFGEKGC